MRYSELNKFTYKELSNFSFGDLSLDKYELMAKAENGSLELPRDIKDKLRSLCEELDRRCPDQSINWASMRLETVAQVASILKNLISIVTSLKDLGLGIALKDILNRIVDFLR